MSRLKVIAFIVTIAITAVLCWGAWWLWNEVPTFLRGTEFSDYSYLASLAAVFLALSLLNPILGWLWHRVIGSEDQH